MGILDLAEIRAIARLSHSASETLRILWFGPNGAVRGGPKKKWHVAMWQSDPKLALTPSTHRHA